MRPAASTPHGPDVDHDRPISPRAPGDLLTPARIATFAQTMFLVLALVAIAYFAKAVVLPVLLACVLAITLQGPMRGLRRCAIPAPLAAAFVVVILVAGAGFAVVHLGRPAVEWLSTAPEKLPSIKVKFRHVLRPAARLSEAASSVGKLAEGESVRETQPVEVKDNRVANTVFTWTGSLLSGATETVALLFLLLAGGDVLQHKLVRAMPRLRDRKRAFEISREIQQSISNYLLSVGLINIGFGILVGTTLYLLGMPNALMWGGVATFANFVPYIGPILGMTSVGIAGLLAFDTIGRGVLPVTAYCVLHLAETYVVTPFILGRRFALNPVLIFVMLIFGTWLWGIIGALLAVPLLVAAKVICDRVPALNSIGDLLTPHEDANPSAAAAVSTPPMATTSFTHTP